jgi:hypothetical protein
MDGAAFQAIVSAFSEKRLTGGYASLEDERFLAVYLKRLPAYQHHWDEAVSTPLDQRCEFCSRLRSS